MASRRVLAVGADCRACSARLTSLLRREASVGVAIRQIDTMVQSTPKRLSRMLIVALQYGIDKWSRYFNSLHSTVPFRIVSHIPIN